jgi:hypothetical protein
MMGDDVIATNVLALVAHLNCLGALGLKQLFSGSGKFLRLKSSLKLALRLFLGYEIWQ